VGQRGLTDGNEHCYCRTAFEVKPCLGILGTEDLENRLGYCREGLEVVISRGESEIKRKEKTFAHLSKDK